jgi:putative phosphoribosyl transferase
VHVSIYADRADAGRRLAQALGSRALGSRSEAVVLGIARGGVVVAAEVARILDLPLDVAVVRKLGAPSHEEFAVGAIADGVRVVNPDALRAGYVTPEQLSFIEDLERVELDRRMRAFEASVVDASATAACLALRAHGPSRIVLAVPVAPSDFRPDRAAIDEFVCPHRARDFGAVGQFYDDFTQTSDDEVTRLLSRGISGA